jgi:sortase A
VAKRTPRFKSAKRVEAFFWIVGVLCLTYVAFITLEAKAAKAQSERIGPFHQNSIHTYSKDLPISAASGEVAHHVKIASMESVGLGKGTSSHVVIGRLEIPSISLVVPILSDFDTESLLKGVGHIQGTAMPGGLGTLGLAGHRDTYFKPLRNIASKMEIRIVDESGTYHYQVDFTEVVTPDKVEVLDIVDRPEMILITCYPFDFIGAAPKRFIVHAHLLSASPDSAN